MNQHFDFSGQVEPYSFVLSYPDHRHLGELVNITERQVNEIFNGANEISFTVHRYVNGIEEELWDLITTLQYIYIPQLDEYFLIEVELDDGEGVVKTVSGIGAGEAELAQSLIYSLEINSELDIAREEYELPTIFYDREWPERSLLHRTLDKLPNWSIGHVDSTLQEIQRTFSVSNKDVYSFLTDEVAEEIGCLFQFDSAKRQINAYDLKTTCKSCGHRAIFDTQCPKCASQDLFQYGKDTSIFVDSENLSTDLTLTTDIDAIKNCFRLVAGDDEMTAAIENQNPNGSAYIYYFSPENKALMPSNLVEKLDSYQELVESYRSETQELAKNIYVQYDKILELTSTMMPGEKFPPTTAEKECSRLNASTLSPLGYYRLSSSTSISSINNTLLMWIRAHLYTGAYKVEVKDVTWSFKGTSEDRSTTGTWRGKIKLTNYSDSEDTFETTPISITVTSDYSKYVEQKLEKLLARYDQKEKANVYEPLKMEDLSEFRKACQTYCLNRLKSFADALDGCLTIMAQEGISAVNPTNEKREFKEKIYPVYLQKLDIVQKEIDVRSKEIEVEEEKLEEYLSRFHEIQKILDFKEYVGDDLYCTFLAYKREQVYENSNYISTDLDNVTIWENAGQFLEVAQEELFKSATYQHQITGSLIDFLSMPEFKTLAENFELGNWIRVRIADDIYRLRLIQIGFNFDDMESIEIKFSDVTKTRTGGDDLASIIGQASSMAGSYDYVKTQVKKSKEQIDIVRDFVNKGLDTSLVQIVNNTDTADIKITDQGLIARRFNEYTQTYEPNEIRLLNDGIYYTNDGWQTSKAGLGKFLYSDPETGEEREGFGIIADQVISNVVLTKQVAVFNTENTIRLDAEGFTFVADCTDGRNKNIFDISKKYKDEAGRVQTKEVLTLDTDGNLVFDGNSMKINLAGSLSTQTFSEALSGQSLARAINESGAIINSASVQTDPDSIRLLDQTLKWKATNSSLTANGTLTAQNVSLKGSFTSEKTNTTKDFVKISDGKISGGSNSIESNQIKFSDSLELQSSKLNFNADEITLKGESLATKTFEVLVVVGEDEEDGTVITERQTLTFKNGLLIE